MILRSPRALHTLRSLVGALLLSTACASGSAELKGGAVGGGAQDSAAEGDAGEGGADAGADAADGGAAAPMPMSLMPSSTTSHFAFGTLSTSRSKRARALSPKIGSW
jgi:hypothetical protein